jgi:plasmid stabilization system protein ParE
MKVRYTAAASRDVYELSRFYAGIDHRLGHRVLDRLSELQSALLHNPRLGFKTLADRGADRRRLLLRSFPYAVYYLIDDAENTIWIISVIHQSRHPGAWKDRVQEQPAVYQLAA